MNDLPAEVRALLSDGISQMQYFISPYGASQLINMMRSRLQHILPVVINIWLQPSLQQLQDQVLHLHAVQAVVLIVSLLTPLQPLGQSARLKEDNLCIHLTANLERSEYN